MNYCSKTRPKRCKQLVLFLIQKEDRKVYIDVTSSKEPSAVLRKHWRGDDKDTQAVFSRNNPKAEPIMWLWEAGYLTRKEAKTFVLEWERLFAAEGYEIIGSTLSYHFRQNPPKLSEEELLKLQKVSVIGLLNENIGWSIECGAEGEERRSPYQKFTTEPADETLRVQAKYETAKRFRSFCKEEGLSHGQGLELLLAEYTGINDPVIWDLQERLIKANSIVEESNHKISELRETVKRLEEGRDYPKKYRTAELQNLLLEDFFNHLPTAKHHSGVRLKQYHYGAGVLAFPQGRDYSFPTEEGIVHIRVEHIRISEGYPHCLFIYGKDNEGNEIKIRWYSVKGNKFGENITNSPYLWENAPWIFSVQKEGDAMEMVGSVPNLGEIWETVDEAVAVVETEDNDSGLRGLIGESAYNEMLGWIREDEELAQRYTDVDNKIDNHSLEEENNKEIILDKNSSLEEKYVPHKKENDEKNAEKATVFLESKHCLTV